MSARIHATTNGSTHGSCDAPGHPLCQYLQHATSVLRYATSLTEADLLKSLIKLASRHQREAERLARVLTHNPDGNSTQAPAPPRPKQISGDE
jgi:hypothetical protein